MVVLLAVPAMAIDLDSDSSPVNLKIMPMAVVTAPAAINVEITNINQSQMGSSSGLDFGTFLISTNLAQIDATANILTPGLSGGTWWCQVQGGSWSSGTMPNTSFRPLQGPIPANTPFDVFVQVTNVDMTAIPFANSFVWDTQLTLTLSIP